MFEGDTDFGLSESDLLSRGFGANPQFGVIVADEGNNKLVGIAVHYNIPFMQLVKPSLMLKWLYVDANQRGKNIGRRLLKVLLYTPQIIDIISLIGLYLMITLMPKNFIAVWVQSLMISGYAGNYTRKNG